jgi:MFS family permease
MTKGRKSRRWVFVLVLSLFLLFHQLDILLLRPVTTQMLSLLHVRGAWIEPVVTLSVGLSIIFALFWGYLYDRHPRTKILALVSFLWGVTSWLAGMSPTLATYLISNFTSGIDNLAVSGIFSLIGDTFGSKNRGKIFGLLSISQPLALFFVVFISTALEDRINWRLLLLVIGAIAFLLTIGIDTLLHEPKRGARERSMTEVPLTGIYLFDWSSAKENLKAPSLLLIFLFSLLGMMPWHVLTTWISPLLKEMNQISSLEIAQRLLPALIAVMIGYPAGGFLGDFIGQKRDVGRVSVAILGMLLPTIFLILAFLIIDLEQPFFLALFILMGFFMSFSWPNMIAVIFEITIPEIRSFTTSIVLALQAIGGLLGSLLVPILQKRIELQAAILTISIGAWLLGFLCLVRLFVTLPGDVENLRRQMAYRSHLERRLGKPKHRSES